ncbi:hypothetical protein FBALC1_07373 [Flavobacteriales bacterium ALC-1]|nr:hypothetical protein FBALC1_07373 [Flavobacteriales bacterium ALC-1]
MNITLKQIFVYLKWVILSLIIGLTYIWILIGPTEKSTNAFTYLLNIFYGYGVLYIGTIFGLVVAFIFVLLDNFYLKKKLKNSAYGTFIRIGVLLMVAVIVGVIHYILEKVVDII